MQRTNSWTDCRMRPVGTVQDLAYAGTDRNGRRDRDRVVYGPLVGLGGD